MKILVTGATGFIGEILVEKLIIQKHQLSVLVRDRKKVTSKHWSSEVCIFEGDIKDPEQIKKACLNQELVIHLAACAHVNAVEKNHHWQVNYLGTENLLSAAKEAKVDKLIYISSSKAKNASTSYGEAKYKSEQLLLSAHMKGEIKVCCLRPCAVYGEKMKGNLSGWIKLIEKGLAPTIPSVKTTIAMIGLNDLCSCISTAISSDNVYGKTFDLSDGVVYSLKEIEVRIRRQLGKFSAVLKTPRAFFFLAAIFSETLNKIPGVRINFGYGGYNVLFKDEYYYSSAFQEETGFVPQQNFYDELSKIIGAKNKAETSGILS